jgi:hypothetical protein
VTELLEAPQSIRTGAATTPAVPGQAPSATTEAPVRPETSEREAPPSLPLWGRSLLRPVAYFVVSRLALLGVALVAAAMFPTLRVVQTLGTVWDGTWYLKIAQHGYPDRLFNEADGSRWAFFPGFPAAVRAVAEVTRLSLPDAAVVTSFAFGLTSAVAIWLAVREIFGERLADRTVLLYVFCPTAYVLSLGYTEGLFLTAAACCLFALSRRYWLTAALCAGVAGLTRNAGIVVILAVLVTALPAAWRGRAWRPLVAAALAPAGLLAFMAYGWAMVGTPIAFLSAERFWYGQHFVWFVVPIKALLATVHGARGVPLLMNAMAGAALILGFAGLWLLDRLSHRLRSVGGAVAAVPASWWVYTVGTLVVAYSAYFTDGIPRYTMAAFPLFVAFAWKLPRSMDAATVGLMACLQGALFFAVLTATVHPLHIPILP